MKNKNREFDLDNQHYELQINENSITETIAKGDISDENFLKIAQSSPFMSLPVEISSDENYYNFEYKTNNSLKFYSELKKSLTDQEKIRMAINILNIADFQNTRFIPVIHPKNILFDINLNPILIHRGIANVLAPQEYNSDDVLKQIKSFVAMILTDKYTFNKLYNGVLDSKIVQNKTVKSISAISNIKDLNTYLMKKLEKQKQFDDANIRRIPTKKMHLYQQGFWVLSVLSLVFAGVLLYLFLIKLPLDRELAASTTDYISTNYDKVIDDLQETSPEKLPKTNQYMLAESYINVENLNHDQKKNLINSITLNSDTNYLKYWIYNGRGEFKKSLDLARFIGDNQLILYSYIKLYDDANTNTKLTGSEKQKQLSSYQKQIDKYTKKVKKETAKDANE